MAGTQAQAAAATPTGDVGSQSDKSGSVTLRVAGRPRHLGIGQTYARSHVISLVQDLHVTVIIAAIGEILRDLTVDPRRDYQPTGRPPGPPKK